MFTLMLSCFKVLFDRHSTQSKRQKEKVSIYCFIHSNFLKQLSLGQAKANEMQVLEQPSVASKTH